MGNKQKSRRVSKRRSYTKKLKHMLEVVKKRRGCLINNMEANGHSNIVDPDPPEILTPEFVHLKDGVPHIEVNGNPSTASQLASQLASNDGTSTSEINTVWISVAVKEEPGLDIEELKTDPDMTPEATKPSDPVLKTEPM